MVPQLKDVYRRISERDVIWYQNQKWVCAKINDCSAKLVPIGNIEISEVKIEDVTSGVRISSGSCVGHHKGISAYNPKETSVLWFIGRIERSQIVVTQTHINHSSSRTRTILGVIEMPMPGSAPKAPKRRRNVAVEESVAIEVEPTGDLSFEPSRAPVSSGLEKSWLTALELAAECVAAISLQGAR